MPLDVAPARADRLWAEVSERLAREQRAKPRARAASMLLALSAAFASGWWLAAPRYTPSAAEIVTSGAPASLTLGDGSRLELAERTQITLDDADPRRVALALAQGDLDCTVSHRPERRFSVTALDYEIVARGTRFSVSIEPTRREVGVVLHEGKVDIYRGGTSQPEASVSAGQRWSSSSARAPTVATQIQAEAVAPSLPDAGTPAEPGAGAAAPRKPTRDEHQQTPRRLLDRGNVLRRDGDLAGAARTYETLLRRYPADARAGLAAFELGRLRMDRLQDPRGAIQALEQAARLLRDVGLREDAMARLVRAFDDAGERERCLAARAAYLEQHATGIHARPVANACGVGR
jgi:hypothetical protein